MVMVTFYEKRMHFLVTRSADIKKHWTGPLCDHPLYYAYQEEILHLQQLRQRARDQVIIEEEKRVFRASLEKEMKDYKVAVTICPEDSHSHTLLFDIIDRIREIREILSGSFVVEQRSKGLEEEKGWHLHMSLNTNVNPSRVRQFINQKLKRKPNISAFVLTTKQYNDDWEERYMKGIKGTNADKDEKVQKDIILRAKYGLKPIYDFRESVTE